MSHRLSINNCNARAKIIHFGGTMNLTESSAVKRSNQTEISLSIVASNVSQIVCKGIRRNKIEEKF